MSKFNPERAIFLNDKVLINIARSLFRKSFTGKGKENKKHQRKLFWKTVYKLYPELKTKHHIYLTGDKEHHVLTNIQIRYKDYKESK